MKTKVKKEFKKKLELEKFQISKLSNTRSIKGGGDWTIIERL